MRLALIGVFTALALAGSASAQFPAPPGWKWVVEGDAKTVQALDPPEGSWLFGTMAPGWHITTRPPVLLFEPSYAGRGRFAVESEIFLFPGPSQAGFGLFMGGRDLDGKPRYVAFLIRRDGSAAVEAARESRREWLHAWTASAAIVPGGTSGDPVKNVLRIEAEAARATFLVNGQQVAEVPRDGTLFDGTVGLRVGADLNLHVTNLDLTHRLALPRPPRPPAK